MGNRLTLVRRLNATRSNLPHRLWWKLVILEGCHLLLILARQSWINPAHDRLSVTLEMSLGDLLLVLAVGGASLIQWQLRGQVYRHLPAGWLKSRWRCYSRLGWLGLSCNCFVIMWWCIDTHNRSAAWIRARPHGWEYQIGHAAFAAYLLASLLWCGVTLVTLLGLTWRCESRPYLQVKWQAIVIILVVGYAALFNLGVTIHQGDGLLSMTSRNGTQIISIGH